MTPERFERLVEILRKELGIATTTAITADSHFYDDFRCEDFDVIDLVLVFESAFDVELPDDLSERIFTVENLVTALDLAIATKAGRAV